MSLDAQILHALRRGEREAVSGTELSQKLRVSRAAVWARIEALRGLGYEIEASPHQGYRLLSAPDLLHADDLTARLGSVRVIGREIYVFQKTTSTNDVVDKLARDGVKEGVAVFAETQTKGRGRLGRKWMSPAGQGLWFSILLTPALRPQEATRLTVASATALRRAIVAQTGLNPQVKWPNDILLGGKKVAGILTELNAEVDRVNYLILGIGVDVNVDTEGFPKDLSSRATSLKAELGSAIDRAELAVAILRELDSDYERVVSGAFAKVADEWEACCSTIGRQVTIRSGQRQLHGRAESLGEDGELLLRSEHGHLERVVGGDVTLEA
ncbi:MAG TPA: biotin--[acetyl-CoA-carboxylase] ligase [Verrucomicrobiae bacterium]|nr:biotin--[acetyl-CoA-carboxylase] ligase [Verrucomicrobiae bacterium]